MNRLFVVLMLMVSAAVAQTSQSEPVPVTPPSATAPQDPTPGAAQTQNPGLTPVPPAPNADPSAVKARTLLDNMLKALGGQAYLTYQTMTSDGRAYSFYEGESRGPGTVFWRFWRYPDKERIEVTKQRDVIYLNVGEAGYEITFKGPAAEEADVLADYVRRRDHSMEIVTREWLKDPQTVVLYSGTGIAEQKLVDNITIINPKNDSVTISIDQTNGLPVQKTFTYRDKDRYKVTDSEVFGNYRLVQGIMTPYTQARKKDGMMMSQRFLNNVDYNTPIPDSKFDAHVTYDPYKLQHKK